MKFSTAMAACKGKGVQVGRRWPSCSPYSPPLVGSSPMLQILCSLGCHQRQPIFISTSRQQPYAAHPKQPELQAAQPQPTFTDGGSNGGTSDSRGKEDDFIEF
ncbi:hypothetical protein VOLCADRAFT_100650 [Volvox carteri f. nagariensis]|uniref:Uncharacterized protein n=1 Tax=Volvox carteri f. nagariensis TaxID=3068 RepID=D8UKQ6_VOLCA|nr:uncharacterized protein VOLCADRAFT_100650 [Volvox carteri f. nagariensis]EFJ39698.1 hypothetical protein VOLCADRAFT_100650 [Volvox carteri f. nagariensis]|eukprot:XP_002959238.1 hypothetical protein VOLCADRAFT_100650 [Volvox carteri f. nagariensis]